MKRGELNMRSKNRASTQESSRPSAGITWLAVYRLGQAAGYLATFPRDITDEPPPETVETYERCSRSRDTKGLALVALQDGVAVLYTRKGMLADRSYRFVFPDDGPVTYHRDSFNVDCQCVPSPAVNISGTEEIASHQEAAEQVSFIEPQLKAAATTSWENLAQGNIRAVRC